VPLWSASRQTSRTEKPWREADTVGTEAQGDTAAPAEVGPLPEGTKRLRQRVIAGKRQPPPPRRHRRVQCVKTRGIAIRRPPSRTRVFQTDPLRVERIVTSSKQSDDIGGGLALSNSRQSRSRDGWARAESKPRAFHPSLTHPTAGTTSIYLLSAMSVIFLRVSLFAASLPEFIASQKAGRLRCPCNVLKEEVDTGSTIVEWCLLENGYGRSYRTSALFLSRSCSLLDEAPRL